MKQYDYIFTGAGLSALMTVYKMVVSGKFQNKRILLLDENAKHCLLYTSDAADERCMV
jgi:lycopene beta-cyclase